MDDIVTIGEIATDAVIAISGNDTVLSAFEEMQNHHIHHFPVVDEERKLIGIVSDRDLVRSLAEQHRRMEKVKNAMTRKVVFVHPDRPAHEAVQLLIDYEISCLPVVDKSGVLVGIVTTRDILPAAREHLKRPRQR